MADKGIIFAAPMVRALLDGRKSQTRRLAKIAKGVTFDDFIEHGDQRDCGAFVEHWAKREHLAVPAYTPGDRLYVREAWTVRGIYTDVVEVGYRVSEKASHTEYVEQIPLGKAPKGRGLWPRWPKYGPSIHMPRWASRLWLEVTEVRVQRLQDISEADAIAEGLHWQEPTDEDRAWAKSYAAENGGSDEIRGVWIVPGTDCGFGPKPRQPLWGPTARNAYASLWNSLHTEPGTRWEDDPWIVAVSFTTHHGNIDGGGNA